MFHRRMTIAITLLACGILSAAEPQSPTKDATDKEAKAPEEPSRVTGFYTILSPEVGGGQFVSGDRLGEVVYISERPALTQPDIEKVRVRPKADRFVIEIKVSKAARERLGSAARLGESDLARSLASVQGLVIVRDGNVEPTYFRVEDLVSKPILQVGTYPSLTDAKAFFDLFEHACEAK